jgi:glycosyltransferase involved in cell wall biosynthesis
MVEEPLRILLITSSDYLGQPFPQRHNYLFERMHDGKEFEVHILRFNIYGKPKLNSKCIIHEIPLEFRIGRAAPYYLTNAMNHVSEILKIINRESIDIIFAANLLPPLAYSLVKNLEGKKIPMIFDFQDHYPASATGYLVDVKSVIGTVFKGFFEMITRHLIKIADTVTVPGIALAIHARQIGAKRVHIIPNGISEQFLIKHSGEEVREMLDYNENDIVVGYVGSIEFWLDMEPLIRAVAMAKSKGLSVRLLLIGKNLQTAYPRKVERWLAKHNVDHITTWLNPIPNEDVPKYIAAMDIATIPFDINNPTAYYAAPNKLWEYLSQGVVIAATPILEVLAYKSIRLVHIVKSSEDYVATIKKREKQQDPYIQQLLKSRLWSRSAEKLRGIIRSVVHGK